MLLKSLKKFVHFLAIVKCESFQNTNHDVFKKLNFFHFHDHQFTLQLVMEKIELYHMTKFLTTWL
ncbi:hypothetical protein BpHYR1_004566 [Brachionus plicatilis]|uniref:Uncharacterized protein n=1 Tax=Brachionus plicatilis TaxID=10195 RepID=A0A3M7Q3N4_BRAPC|nr:hypothetical protein BpHYR1_004566 [Brachionus plicatilis]